MRDEKFQIWRSILWNEKRDASLLYREKYSGEPFVQYIWSWHGGFRQCQCSSEHGAKGALNRSYVICAVSRYFWLCNNRTLNFEAEAPFDASTREVGGGVVSVDPSIQFYGRYGVDGGTVEFSGKVSVGKIKSEIRRVEWYLLYISTLSIMWGSQSCLSNSYKMPWLLFISAFKIAGHIEWSQVSTSWEAIISGKFYRPMKSNKPLWFDACVATYENVPSLLLVLGKRHIREVLHGTNKEYTTSNKMGSELVRITHCLEVRFHSQKF